MIHLLTASPALDLDIKLERSRRGKIGLLEHCRWEAGGKAVNLSRFLGKWNVAHRLWLGAGGGEDPAHFLHGKLLKQEGLSATFLDLQAPIRMNAVVDENGVKGKYNHLGFPLRKNIWKTLLKSVRSGDHWVLAGRLPRGMDPQSQAQWILSAQKKGAKVLLDTSGQALWAALKAKPWFFKVNLYELSEVVRQRFQSLEQVPALMRKMGLEHGAVTDGPNGAVLWEKGECFRVRMGKPVNGSLVVGAGDAFMAGYLKALMEKMPLIFRAVLANACGAAVARTDLHRFSPLGVSQLLKYTVLKRIS